MSFNSFEITVREKIGKLNDFIVAVSGGADSVSLLHCMVKLRYNLKVLHCNFHLRGEESIRDEMFVTDLCHRLGVELLVKHFDVEEYCHRNKVSVEMACRDLRYEWFYRKLKDLGFSRIVVAHNSDDNIETLFLNLFRGTGINGLCGMSVDNGEILRPLLGFSRKEIEDYLRGEGVDYIVDSSNLESDYRRNYIRNELLPQIEKRWSGVRKAITRTQKNLRGVEEVYAMHIDDIRPANLSGYRISQLSATPGMTSELYEILKPYGGNAAIAEEMAKAINTPENVGRRWYLPEYEIVLERDGFHFNPLGPCVSENLEYEVEELPMTELVLEQVKKNVDKYVIYLPEEITHYQFRRPRVGDRIYPLGMKGSQLVSDIMKDAKLTTAEKRKVWVLEEKATSRIIWIAGLKRSCHHLVKPSSQKVYKITCKS